MPYAFPPDLRQLVLDAMATGRFQNEDDLLRDALAAWRDRLDDVALRESIGQMQSGAVRPFADAMRDLSDRYGFDKS